MARRHAWRGRKRDHDVERLERRIEINLDVAQMDFFA
jgi:hypothetical protein